MALKRLFKNLVKMRCSFIILLCIAVASCSSQSDVVKDYIISEVQNVKPDTIFMVQEPLDRQRLITFYEAGLKESTLPDTSYRFTYVYPNDFIKWPFNEQEVNELKARFHIGTTKWSPKDFGEIFIYVSKDSIRTPEFIKKHIGPKNYVLYVSKPIFNKNKKKAIYHFEASLIVGGKGPFQTGIMIMEKKKGKWVRIAILWEHIYH